MALLPQVAVAHTGTHLLFTSTWANDPLGHLYTHASPSGSPNVEFEAGQIETHLLVELSLNR